MDLGWTPFDDDGRNYDAAAIAAAADYVFVMAYNIQSEVWSHGCVASANAPAREAIHGLRQYLSVGVPPEKIVFAPPWCGLPPPPRSPLWPSPTHQQRREHAIKKSQRPRSPTCFLPHEASSSPPPATAISPPPNFRLRTAYAFACEGVTDLQTELCPMRGVPSEIAPCGDDAGYQARKRHPGTPRGARARAHPLPAVSMHLRASGHLGVLTQRLLPVRHRSSTSRLSLCSPPLPPVGAGTP